jgi:hypothetical protein
LLGGSYMTAKYLGTIEKGPEQKPPDTPRTDKAEEKKP